MLIFWVHYLPLIQQPNHLPTHPHKPIHPQPPAAGKVSIESGIGLNIKDWSKTTLELIQAYLYAASKLIRECFKFQNANNFEACKVDL